MAVRPRAVPLSVRLVATYALLVAASLLVVAGLVVRLARTHLAGTQDRQLAAVVDSFEASAAPRVERASDLAPAARRWLAVQALPEDQVAAVRTADGEVLTSAGGIDLGGVLGARGLLEATASGWRDLEGSGGPIRALAVPLVLDGRQVGTLVVAGSRVGLEATLSALLSGIGWASGAGFVFAVALGAAAVRRTLRPLGRMSRTVEEIQAVGDLSRRLAHRGPADEVGRLAEAFDRMLARLEEAFRSQQRFLSDASHELRTPLTVVRGQLELLEQELADPDARRSLAVAMEELDRMRRIVEDLLLLARLDEGMPLAREPVEVELVMREALLRGMLPARREATVDLEPGLYVLGDPDRLLQALTNLVTNAVQHAGDDARVTLAARREPGRVVMEVSDTGRGIPPEDLPHVFDRLYRGSRARSDAPGGAGLGLPIAASLIRAMGGEIEAISTAGRGTTFRATLPPAEAPAGDLVPERSSPPSPARSPGGRRSS